jgi:hypothetical protein
VLLDPLYHLTDRLDRELTQGEKRGCTLIQNSIRDKKKLSLYLRGTFNRDLETHSLTAVESTQESLHPIQLDVSEESESSITPIVSLTSLLKQDIYPNKIRRVSNPEAFSPTERDKLCLNLALSLLHMTGHNWDRAEWYSEELNEKEGIFFLRDPSTQNVVDITKPYLSWRLQKESGIQESIEEPGFQEHAEEFRCDTQLLSFASLLVEIHGWKRLNLKPKSAPEDCYSDILKYIDLKCRRADSPFISALKGCLNPHGYTEAAARDDPSRIQNYCFEYIVKPLHTYLGNPALSDTTSTVIASSDQAAPAGSNQSENAISSYDSSYSCNESQTQE